MSENFFWYDSAKEDLNNFLITGNESYTYKEIFSDADNLFRESSRDIILIFCDKSISTITSYIGAIRNNIVPLLVDKDIKGGALKNILKAYKPKYILIDSSKNISEIYSENIVESRLFKDATLYNFDVIEKKLHNDLALLLLTSGSTGDPKSVRISKRNLQVATENITKYLKLDHTSISLSLLPFHYSYGLSVIHNAIYTRSSILINLKDVLDKTLWTDCIKYKVTDISAVPFILELMSRMSFPDSFYEKLKRITQAGGRLEPRLTKHFIKLSQEKNFEYYTMYGQTEASPRISYVPPSKALLKLGSVGKPLDCGDVFIEEHGNKSGDGELIYTGDNVCMGYASSFLDLSEGDLLKGILKTGDIARIDEDNFITIIGRKKRFIKLKGISVNLDFVESLVKSSIQNAMVIGKDDNLIIVVEEFIDEKDKLELKEIIKNNFNFHSSLIRIKEDTLPKMSSGKPDYKKLTEKYLSC